ncbi:MAG: type 4a pilus biogenesis protein PilO [Candidatus Omnitrophica bacterium]|nr:type 4a pilus biogenesis protein PilO [Candidatus Omnitrophota bacterium]
MVGLESMKNIGGKKKEVMLLTLLLVSIACILYITFIIQPLMHQIGELNSELSETKSSVEEAESAITREPLLRKRAGELRTQLKDYSGRFSIEGELPVLLETLSELAIDTKVKIVSIRPKETPDTESKEIYREVPIAIEAKCGYHRLAAFINRLENSETIFRIDDLFIAADLDSAREHDIKIVLSSFFLKEGQEGQGKEVPDKL